MPRRARVVIPNIAHHAIQRGNYQQYVFEKEEDFRTYLYLISQYSKIHQLKIHAFCLMNNHVHFIITPTDQNGLAELFKSVHARYSQYKNLQKRRLGHLWQGRFYSCMLSDQHLLRAIRYVEMNPVRAKMVRKPWDYVWSSTRQHLKMERKPIIETVLHDQSKEGGLNWSNWKEYLLLDDFEMTKDIRNKTQKGLALGSLDFIIGLEKKLGVDLRELKAGRPRIRKK